LKELNIRSLIDARLKHMLWKDECGDDLLLTKSGEIYRYSKTHLRAILWNRSKASQMRNKGYVQTHATDDGLFLINFPKDDLIPVISHLGRFRKRPNLSGDWLNDKRERLAHQIIPFKPSLG